MIKRLGFIIGLIIFFLLIFLTFYFLNFFQSEKVFGQEKVVYNLPYPGILPDHPLYFLKVVRDKLLDFGTRDYLKKARLYLLFSDKRVNMAIFLIKKGKNKLAITTFSKGEKYFLKIPALLEKSKKQGVSPSSDFIETLKVSNSKHKEVGEELLKLVPQTQAVGINEILKINKEIKEKLEKL